MKLLPSIALNLADSLTDEQHWSSDERRALGLEHARAMEVRAARCEGILGNVARGCVAAGRALGAAFLPMRTPSRGALGMHMARLEDCIALGFVVQARREPGYLGVSLSLPLLA